ncbi:MAG: hypothetical protein ABIK62_01375 [candidate division WOR-3 bacterium]
MSGYKVVRKVLLVAYGIDAKGSKEVIGFRLVRAESERECELFLLSRAAWVAGGTVEVGYD